MCCEEGEEDINEAGSEGGRQGDDEVEGLVAEGKGCEGAW
jgi:hypothetical protein